MDDDDAAPKDQVGAPASVAAGSVAPAGAVYATPKERALQPSAVHLSSHEAGARSQVRRFALLPCILPLCHAAHVFQASMLCAPLPC